MPDGQIKPVERLPTLWIAMGRQRVGKTVLLNTAIQYFREAGSSVRVWNADQQNRSHTLSIFFPDAEEVPVGGIEDGKAWIESRIEDLIKHRYNAVLDVGGGATGFARLLQEVPLLEAIEGCAVRVVGLFCIGPETADLDYLEQFAGVDMFMPSASVIVLNAGLVLTGKSAANAFKPMLEHPAIKSALKRGARVATMPALGCMSDVTDLGLTFTKAMNAEAKPGGEPLSFLNRTRVHRWWTRDVPAFFNSIPQEWQPMASAEVRESEAG